MKVKDMTPPNRRGRISLVILACALAVALTACAGGQNPNNDPAHSTLPGSSNTETGTVPTEPTEQPNPNDSLACLHGPWVADNEYFLQSIGEFGNEVHGVSGLVTLNFGADGSLTTEYRDWLITAIVEGDTVTIHRDGTDVGAFVATADKVSLSDTHVGSTMTLTAAGVAMYIDPDPAMYSNADYTCDQSAASITTLDGTLKLTRP